MGRDWFEKVLRPESVALIGASNDPKHTGGRIQGYLERYGYQGSVFPVNPSRDSVQGKRAFPSVLEIDDPVDLAIITVPASQVADALTLCGQKGIGVAYVGTSGFSEIGSDGLALQIEVEQAAKKAGVRLIGPNGNGLISVRSKFAASFMSGLDQSRFDLADQGIGLVSQSGAVGAFIFTLAQASGVGIGTFLSTGNEADVTFEELVIRLLEDEGTRIVLGYVEGLRDGPAFVRAARRARKLGKTIVLLKVGRTAEGADAAASHTAALVGEDGVYDGVLRQLGVVRASSIAHLLDVARLLIRFGDRSLKRMTVFTISGGLGIMLSDRASQAGINLAHWSPELRARLQAHLPAWASTKNPIDTTGLIARDHECLSNLLQISEENQLSDFTVLALGNFESTELETSELLLDLAGRLTKPIIPIWVAGSGQAMDRLNRGGLPCFAEPAPLIEALASVVARHRDGGPSSSNPNAAHPLEVLQLVEEARSAGATTLDEVAGKRILALYGIPTVIERIVRTPDDVSAAIHDCGFPLVAKLRSRFLSHKSDLGGVKTGLATKAQANSALKELQLLGRALEIPDASVVLQAQIPAGIELLLGMKVDPTFGPVITLGVGGVFADALDDVQVALAELNARDVNQMLDSLRSQRLLQGYRGMPIVSGEAIGPAVLNLARLASDLWAEFSSIDINPLIVYNPGPRVSAVDALFVLSSGSSVEVNFVDK